MINTGSLYCATFSIVSICVNAKTECCVKAKWYSCDDGGTVVTVCGVSRASAAAAGRSRSPVTSRASTSSSTASSCPSLNKVSADSGVAGRAARLIADCHHS